MQDLFTGCYGSQKLHRARGAAMFVGTRRKPWCCSSLPSVHMGWNFLHGSSGIQTTFLSLGHKHTPSVSNQIPFFQPPNQGPPATVNPDSASSAPWLDGDLCPSLRARSCHWMKFSTGKSSLKRFLFIIMGRKGAAM